MTTPNNVEYTKILTAVKQGDADALKEYLNQKFVFIYVKDENGVSLLDIATLFKHEEIAQILAEEQEKSSSFLASMGWTPLHLAASINDVVILSLLLKSGYSPNAQDKEGNTCLHLASIDDCTNLIEALIKARASMEIWNAAGMTPLHEAVRNNSMEATKLLLNAGADVNAEDAQGHTPMQLAEERESVLMDENEYWADTEGESTDTMIYLLYPAVQRAVDLLHKSP